MAVNRAVISGNLVRDPELRTTQSGTSVLTFTVAVNDRKQNRQTGRWEDYPNYIPCVMFGNRSEKVEPYLAKGIKVCVEGKLRWSKFETRDGESREKIEVVVDELELMTAKTTRQEPAQESPRYTPDYSNEIIPF